VDCGLKAGIETQEFPGFIQLMVDDIVSLTGLILMLIVDPLYEECFCHITITQLPLSLYLMTQCRIKLYVTQ